MIEIFVTTQFTGFHKWKEAPKKVDFLRNKHRHIFYVKVWFKVSYDRQLEFFIQKEKLDNYIKKNINTNNVGSCEGVCTVIANMDNRITKVEVSEDRENGAILNV